MKWLDIAKVIAGTALSAIPGAAAYTPFVQLGLQIAEESTSKGPDKKQIAVDAAQLTAGIANKITNTNAFDPTTAGALTSNSVDYIVSATNQLHQKVNAPTNPTPVASGVSQ